MGHGIAVTEGGSVWLTGWSNSADFPIGRPNAYDAFVYGSQGAAVASLTMRADCIFQWAQRTYPQIFPANGGQTQTSSPYYLRYYSATNSYLAVSLTNSHFFYMGSNGQLQDLGLESALLSGASCQ
jgi:hypothetical protein